MSKARKEPWNCEAMEASRSCDFRAIFHCPSCDKIFCDVCFSLHKRVCKVFNETDQCLCIWPEHKEWPACGHDNRGPKGARGQVGLGKESLVKFEGPEVAVHPCLHCGAEPDWDWVVAQSKWWGQTKCKICGICFKVTKLKIEHLKDEHGDRWRARAEEHEPWVSLEKETPTGHDLKVLVHEACLDKAFPFGWR